MYLVPQGTLCSIALDDSHRAYRPWRVRKDLYFPEYRTCLSGAMTFEREGWVLLVRSRQVRLTGRDITLLEPVSG